MKAFVYLKANRFFFIQLGQFPTILSSEIKQLMPKLLLILSSVLLKFIMP